MTTTDWIIDITLVLIVLRQLREEKFTLVFLLIPAGIVAFTAHLYLHSVPTGGNDLLLVVAAATVGTVLGLAGGVLTKVRGENGAAYVKAGWGAAALWVASMGARLGFIIWITHAAGGAALARFSAEHHITGADAWQTALVLLALTEVVARMVVIAVRARSAARNTTPAEAPRLVTV